MQPGNKTQRSAAIYTLLLFLLPGILLFGADRITFSADNMKTVLAKGKERTQLNGNALIETGKVRITADYIELYGKNQSYVSCSGNIFVLNLETGVEIDCEKLFFDRDKNMIRIQGNAVMEDKKNEIIIKGGFIENWEDEDLTIIQIGVRILKEDMVCRSESARYYREKEYLELSGMPVVIKEGDEYRALKINIDLENDKVEMEGNVKGEVIWEEESTEDPKAQSSEKPIEETSTKNAATDSKETATIAPTEKTEVKEPTDGGA